MNRLFYRIIRKTLTKVTSNGRDRKIYFGVLKGMKWIYSSGYSEYFMGDYEREVAEIFYQYSQKSKVIYDLGANVGFYTLIASKAIGNQGKIYAFEPLPSNIYALRKNIGINNKSNIHILENAVSDVTGELVFSNTDNNVANSLRQDSPMFIEGKTIKVQSVKLDDLVSGGKIDPPDLLKIDVEGSEYEVLIGSMRILSNYHPTIFLSTHNCHVRGIHRKCCEYLKGIGYEITYLTFRENKTENDDPWYEVLAEFKN